jgi:vacuolar-type H+-ATPase subunit H
MTDSQKPRDEHRLDLYHRMMERVKHSIEEAGEKVRPRIEHALETAREKSIELGEATREEAEEIASYIRRDLAEIGEYLHESGEDIGTWFHMDLELIEANLLDLITSVADKTRVELAEIAARAQVANIYQTGEITGPGTLTCSECGEELHFQKAGHVPPCPRCHATTFTRKRP